MRLLAPHRALALAIFLPIAIAASGQHNPPRAASTSENAVRVSRARKLLQQGDPQGAITQLDTADLQAASASSAGEIHTLKGICLALLAQPVASEAEFDAAIALRPNDAPTYLSAGLAFAGFHNLERALDLLAAALKLDPRLPGARYNYALVLARAGKFAESDTQAQLELQVELADPRRNPESVQDLWRLKARDAYYQKKWPETVKAYMKTLELDPGWPEAYGAVGEALFSLNRSEDSLPMLQKSEALDPDNATTHTLLGTIDQDAGKTAAAISEFETALRLRPDDQGAMYHLLRLYRQNGDTANATLPVQRLKDLAASRYNESLGENKASASNGTGLAMDKQGDLTGALRQFDQAAAEDPANPIFQRNAALILCKLGRTGEAIRRLRDILDLDPDDATALQILAVAKEYERKRSGNLPKLPSLQTTP